MRNANDENNMDMDTCADGHFDCYHIQKAIKLIVAHFKIVSKISPHIFTDIRDTHSRRKRRSEKKKTKRKKKDYYLNCVVLNIRCGTLFAP